MKIGISIFGEDLSTRGGYQIKLVKLVDGLVQDGISVQLFATKKAIRKAAAVLSNSPLLKFVSVDYPIQSLIGILHWRVQSWLVDYSKLISSTNLDLVDFQHPMVLAPHLRIPYTYNTNFSWSYALNLVAIGQFRYASLFFPKCIVETL